MSLLKIQRVLEIGIIKTLFMNIKYFGLKSIFHPPMIVAKNVKLLQTKGSIKSDMPLGVGSILLGFNSVGIFDKKYERTVWHNSGIVQIRGGGKIVIGSGSRISNHGMLVFNGNFKISANSTIICVDNVSFGNDCLVSWNVTIMDTDFHKIYDLSQPSTYVNLPSPIVFGDHVWIGCESIILKGVNIPDGTVIGASSVITKSFSEENTIIVNNAVLKHNIGWRI